MPTTSNVIQEDGKMDLSWRSYFQFYLESGVARNAQLVTPGGQIGLAFKLNQVIPLNSDAPVTTDNIAFSGRVPNGARITLASLDNNITIKENDSDGGCIFEGVDFVLAPKRTVSLIYFADIKRFLKE